MRPRLPDNEKRNKPLIIRVSREEKIRIKSHTRNGKYACMSDFIRTRLFNSNKKVISLDEEASTQIKRMDYELNKIGVNLNQIAKKSISTMFTSLLRTTERFLNRYCRSSEIVFRFYKNIWKGLTQVNN